MTAGKEHVHKMKLRKSYRNVWHTDLMSTMAADTPYCCFALFCGPCASYKLRKRALYEDMSRYTCCGGYMPCSGKCGERKCPKFCLCAEVFLCFGNSVASTRFMLQDEFNIQTTKCDNCIITQHKVEMDKRDGKFGMRPMDVPPVQEMSRIDQQYPPPHVQYGQPHYGYPLQPPPPQPQGYPPMYPPPHQGYPPAAYPPGYPPAAYPPPPHQGYPAYPSQPPPPHGQGHPPGPHK